MIFFKWVWKFVFLGKSLVNFLIILIFFVNGVLYLILFKSFDSFCCVNNLFFVIFKLFLNIIVLVSIFVIMFEEVWVFGFFFWILFINIIIKLYRWVFVECDSLDDIDILFWGFFFVNNCFKIFFVIK